jgi:hypothetical protein
MNQEQFEIGSMIAALCYVFLPAAIGGVHLAFKKGLQLREKAKIFLNYYVFISVGLQGLIAGSSQLFFATNVASYVQWPYSPFLLELGMANLAFGMLGVLSWWIKGSWRLAAACGYGVFLIFAAIGHLYDALFNGNLSMGNLGPQLWSDILVPAAIFGLMYISLQKAK